MEPKQPLLMHINNSVFLRNGNLVMIDRRLLPRKINEVVASTFEEVAHAIEDMVVQGAGDIAITAGYGLYLAACQAERTLSGNLEEARSYILSAQQRLMETRPTGRHLSSLLEKMADKLEWDKDGWANQLLNEVNLAIDKQQRCSESTGKWASEILENGDVILTHCFPGAALLYMLAFARDQGKRIEVISTETRPYLQGARLTAWSVSEMDIPVTLITDNMGAYCMDQGMVNKVFTAADRIAMDGTVANKVGTLQLALSARYHQITLYILGYGGPDRHCPTGDEIPIEIRNPEEVLCINGVNITGEKVKGFYPAFDLTPPRVINEIITDRGSFVPYNIRHYWSLSRS
ncbi:MAG: s-methyl-5-thioribose-1-phosphate isomerase [Syntrophomonas sp.]